MYVGGRNPMLKRLQSLLSQSKIVCLLAQIPGLRSTLTSNRGILIFSFVFYSILFLTLIATCDNNRAQRRVKQSTISSKKT